MTNQHDTIKIHNIDKTIVRIALGTWAIGGSSWGGPDDDNAIKTIHAALDNGINMIDTAPVYGFGHAEEVVGKALKGKRDNIVLATKVGLNWDNSGKMFRDSSPKRIQKEIEDSLRRLNTDYIDLYQIHWPDDKTPIKETAQAMEKLRKEGKIKAIGVSNFSTKQIEEFSQYADLAAIQPPYNMFERSIENDILPCAEKHKLATLCYGSICRGLLSGKMNKNTKFTGDDLRKSDPKFQPPLFEHYLAATRDLEEYAQKNYNKSLLALAVRWVIDRYKGNIALWGARKPQQINGVQDALGWQLTKEDYKKLDEILAKHIKKNIEPSFMAPPSR